MEPARSLALLAWRRRQEPSRRLPLVRYSSTPLFRASARRGNRRCSPAPTLSAGVSVLLLIGRTSWVRVGSCQRRPHRPDSDGRAGRKSVWRRWYRPSPAGKRTVRRDDDGVDAHFGVVGGVQAVSGCAGKRDDPIVAIGTAIVNPHDDHPSVGKVSDPRVARDRQRRVRCGQLSRIEGFAAGGQVAVGFCVIDRRETGLSKLAGS